MRRSSRLSVLASMLLLAAGLGRPVLCIEADGLVRLESGIVEEGCCAGDARTRRVPGPVVAGADCGCTDSVVALVARPSDPSVDDVPVAPAMAGIPGAFQTGTTPPAPVGALTLPPPSPTRSIVLRL